MTELQKTLAYLVSAAASIGIACGAFALTSGGGDSLREEVGQPLFPDLTDPADIARLEIVKYDERTGKRTEFSVVRSDGIWTIPSHGGYPSDAKEQVAQAATAVMGLEIEGIASELDAESGDHERLGVVAPTDDAIAGGQMGIGMRVKLSNAEGDVLCDMVIGNEVPQRDGEQRFVRRIVSDERTVYVTSVDPADLSTSFEDWIDPNIIHLGGSTIQRIALSSTDPQLRLEGAEDVAGQSDYRFTVQYDDERAAWNLVSFEVIGKQNEFVPRELAADEVPDDSALNDLRDALRDLRIVDVERKPAAYATYVRTGVLRPTSRADEDAINESLRSLAERGFIPDVLKKPETLEIVNHSVGGNVVCTASDGVEYVLHFGGVEGIQEADKKEKPDENSEKDDGEEAGDGEAKESLKRYMFITVGLDKSTIPPPALKPIPDKLPETDSRIENLLPPEPVSAEEEKKEEEDRKQKLERLQKRTESENQRLQKEYDETIEKAELRVKEQTDRFADWYYVISGDVYKRIRIGQDKVVKKKDEPMEPGDGDSGGAPPFGRLPDIDRPR